MSKARALWGWPFTPFRLWEDNFIRIHEPSRFGTRLACWLSRWHQTWFVWWKSGAPVCVFFWWSRVWRDWIHWIHPGAILPNIELEVTRVQSSTTSFFFRFVEFKKADEWYWGDSVVFAYNGKFRILNITDTHPPDDSKSDLNKKSSKPPWNECGWIWLSARYKSELVNKGAWSQSFWWMMSSPQKLGP